jgi:hypothetical protein
MRIPDRLILLEFSHLTVQVNSVPHHHCSLGNPEDELVTACNQAAFNQCKSNTCAGIQVLLVTAVSNIHNVMQGIRGMAGMVSNGSSYKEKGNKVLTHQ